MKTQEGIVVLCSYKPRPGKHEELVEVLKDHVITLRMQGLATSYPRQLFTSADGTVVEIFEWESEKAARSAHENPAVGRIWKAIGELADFVPLSSLTETHKPFAHFKQLES